MSYLPTEVAVAIATVIDEAFDRWAETQDRPTLERFALSLAKGVKGLNPRTLSRRMSRDREALKEWQATGVFSKRTQARKAWEFAKMLRHLDQVGADQIEAHLRCGYFAGVWDSVWRGVSPSEWMTEATPRELAVMLGGALDTGRVLDGGPHLWRPNDVTDEDWLPLEWNPSQDAVLPSIGLPQLDRDPDALRLLRRFVDGCRVRNVPEPVARGAIGRILSPLTARARTQGLAPGWEDLSAEDCQEFLRLGIRREKLILGDKGAFDEVAARRRYESTFVEKTIPLTKDLEAVIERDESDFQAARDSGEIELEGADPWESD